MKRHDKASEKMSHGMGDGIHHTYNQGEPVSNTYKNAYTSVKDNSMKKLTNDLDRNFTNEEIQIVH